MYNRWMPGQYYNGGELYHYGVLGMKWGVRKERSYRVRGGSGYRHYNRVNKHLGDRQTIKKGTKMYRMTTEEHETGNGSTYVTFQQADRDFYRKYITSTAESGKAFEKEYVLNKDISIPSRDEVRQAYSDAVLAIGKESVEKATKEFVLGEASPIYSKRLSKISSALQQTDYPTLRKDGKYDIYDEYVTGKKLITCTEKELQNAEKYSGRIKTYDDIMRRVENKTMSDFALGMGTLTKNPKVKEHMIKSLSSKGYNAIIDEAGVGTITDWKKPNQAVREGVAPLIVFDRNVLTERKSTLYDGNDIKQYRQMNVDYNKYYDDMRRMRAREAI